MDLNLTVAVGSFIVAVLALIVPFVVHRFVGRARLNPMTLELSRLDADKPTDRVQVKVFHDAQLIQEPVFLWRLALENTGGKDITKDEFLDPITVSMGPEIEILSADFVAPEGVKPIWNLNRERQGEVKWSILKPGEFLGIKIVGRALSLGLTPESVKAALHHSVRLRDVRLGSGWKWRNAANGAFTGAFLMMAGGGLLGTLLDDASSGRWTYEAANGRAYHLVDDLRACPVDRGYFERCASLSPSQAKAAMAVAERKSSRTGWKTRLVALLVLAGLFVVVVGVVSLVGRLTGRREAERETLRTGW